MKIPGIGHLQRLAVVASVAMLGLGASVLFSWQGLEHSLGYTLLASGLLCFGLYMAVYGIDREEAKLHWRIVLIAVTIGVLLKYLIIFAAAYSLTRNWQYAIFGMAVAQIDPLSVAALGSDTRLNGRTRTILNMWASFDDPMTAVATPIVLGVAANVAHHQLATNGSWVSVLVDMLPFAAALLVVGSVALMRRTGFAFQPRISKAASSESSKHAIVSLVGLIAVPTRLYSLAAMTGWFVRPAWIGRGRRAEFALNIALYGSAFLLGILLAGGVDWRGGVILGVATYGSQIIVAWCVMWLARFTEKRTPSTKPPRLSKHDTWQLALSQQNGITAIVLALNLEPLIHGAVASISLAIMVINVLHFSCNWLYDSLVERYVHGPSVV